MNRFSSLFVLALASCMVLKSAAQCTPATCPPGPVTASFQYSNCTGEVTYSSLSALADMECQVSSDSSAFARFDSDGMYYYSAINNLNCDLTSSNSSYSLLNYWFGTCIPAGAARRDAFSFGSHELLQQRDGLAVGASMYLYSVNSSFIAPQEPQEPGNPKNLTSLDTALLGSACYSPHNCTREDGTTPDIIFTTYSESGNCSSGVGSAYLEGQIGVCYFSTNFYASIACSTDHGYALEIFVDDNCQKRLISQGFVDSCSNTRTADGYQCTSPVGPVTAPPPSSSSSSSLSIAPLAIIITLIFVLLL